jgi:hypothetical protein
MERHPTRPALTLRDEEDPLIQVDITESKPKSFAEPDPRAIEDEQERPI